MKFSPTARGPAIECDSFGTLIGPPKMQEPALCDHSLIYWNFSKIRYPSPWTLNNEILSQYPRTFKFNVIPLRYSSDLQKWNNISVRPDLYFLEFFKNEVPFSSNFEKWNSLPQLPDLRFQCDSFGTLIGPPKMQEPALCDHSLIYWNFSNIR